MEAWHTDRREHTGAGRGHSSSSVHAGARARKRLQGETKITTKKYRYHANNQQRDLRHDESKKKKQDESVKQKARKRKG